MRVARTLVLASTTLAACSLNLDGFTGGAPNADAGAPAPPPPEPPQATTDASTSDAADAASPPSCPSDAIFCEGFETFSGWDGMDQESGATCAVTTSRAHTGTHALRAFGPAVPSGGMQNQCYYQHALPQPPPARLAMRAFVYVVSPIGNGSGWDPIQTHAVPTSTACQSGSMYQGYDSNGAFATFGTATSTSSVRAASALPLPTDRWTCVEYVFDESANGHFTMYVDDVAVIDAAAKYADGDPFCGFADIDVGLAGHFTDHDLEIEWDDVVVAPHRIGCQ